MRGMSLGKKITRELDRHLADRPGPSVTRQAFVEHAIEEAIIRETAPPKEVG